MHTGKKVACSAECLSAIGELERTIGFVGARALTQGKLSALLLYALGGVFGLSGLVIGIVQRLWLLCGFMILVAIVFFILAAKLSAASKETA